MQSPTYNRHIISVCTLALMLALVSVPALAQPPFGLSQPGAGQIAGPAGQAATVITVTISSYDELMGDLGFIGQVVGRPQLADGIKGMVVFMTQGKGLQGVDTSQPVVGVVQIDPQAAAQAPVFALPQALRVLVYLPITDLKAFLEAAQGLVGQAQAQPDGSYLIARPGQPPAFLKQVGSWTVLTTDRNQLASAPTDPLAIAGSMPQKYDIAIKATISSIPKALRDQVKQIIQAQSQQRLAPLPGEDPSMHAFRVASAQRQQRQLSRLLDEVDSVLLGLNIDRTAGQAYLELVVAPVSGSTLQQDFALEQNVTSRLGAFAPSDALFMLSTSREWSDRRAQEALEVIRDAHNVARAKIEQSDASAQDKQRANDILQKLVDCAIAVIQAKKAELAFSLVQSQSGVALLGAATVAKSDVAASALRDILGIASQEIPETEAKVQLDAETIGPVKLHKITVPIDPDMEDRDKVVQLVGDPLVILVGTGPERIYLAAGADAKTRLQEAIQKTVTATPQPVPAMQASVDLSGIAEVLKAIAPDASAQKVADAILKVTTGVQDDHITLEGRSDSTAAVARLTLQPGVIRAIGELVKQFQPAGAAPAPVPGTTPGQPVTPIKPAPF